MRIADQRPEAVADSVRSRFPGLLPALFRPDRSRSIRPGDGAAGLRATFFFGAGVIAALRPYLGVITRHSLRPAVETGA